MRKPRILSTCLVAALLAGCSLRANEPAPSDEMFGGLDPSVVSEVLANPKAIANVTPLPDDEKPSMWQGMVQNFIVCRRAYQAYQSWLDTGQRPASVGTIPQPTHPESSFKSVQTTYEYYDDALASGDISNLRTILLSDSGCGVWIPVTAGDSDGPTIADAVRASS